VASETNGVAAACANASGAASAIGVANATANVDHAAAIDLVRFEHICHQSNRRIIISHISRSNSSRYG
jgi:hypothetical protein